MSQPKPLLEKMLEIYKTVDFIPKNGYNKSQSYKFMRAADVVIELRKNLIAQRVYVEVNYGFSGPAYTIAREKAPSAPFSAVSVVCTLVFHDLDSAQTLTASGVGTGCDTNDKAGYKAMTGALKYALKNAFLVPDEADPEGDESVEETRGGSVQAGRGDIEMPDFQEAQHAPAQAAAPRKQKAEPLKKNPTPAPASQPETGATAAASNPAPAPAGVPPANKPNQAFLPTSSPSQPSTSDTSANSESTTPVSSPVFAQSSPEPEGAEREPGDESETVDMRLPNGEELATYRKAFQKLGDDLSTEGGLTQSPKLPIERKLLAFLLNITGANAAKEITNEQWKSFFARVDAGRNAEAVGLKGITVLVNRVSGVEPKAAKAKK